MTVFSKTFIKIGQEMSDIITFFVILRKNCHDRSVIISFIVILGNYGHLQVYVWCGVGRVGGRGLGAVIIGSF